MESESLFRGKWLALKRTQGGWEFVERVHHCPGQSDGVDVLALVSGGDLGDETRVLCVLVYLQAVHSVSIELVGGLLESKEDLGRCALREVQEETGLQATLVEAFGACHSDPWKSTETSALVIARVDLDDEKNQEWKQSLDQDEQIQVVYFPVEGLVEALLGMYLRKAE